MTGKGVHSGQICHMRLLPGIENSGYIFQRVDLPGRPEIPGRLENLVADALLRRTTLAVGDAKVFTIEHVLSAAAGLGVTNLRIEMNAAEPPFLDGSALPYADALQTAGIAEQGVEALVARIEKPLVFADGDAEIVALPSETFRVTYFFSSAEPLLRSQSATVELTAENYMKQVAPARTFCFFHEIEQLRRANLIAGGNLQSAVVIGRKGILNNHLRFPDEPVRHKILDFVGDLALLGATLRGHFLAWRAGHRVNAAFALHLRKELGF